MVGIRKYKNSGTKQKIEIIIMQILPVKIRVILENIGIFKSITSNSFVKMFIILPKGAVSKNEIGACKRESINREVYL